MSELRQPQTDQVWMIELRGIEPIMQEERHGSPF